MNIGGQMQRTDFTILLGKRIKEVRLAANITQEKLAEKIKVAPETISRLERGSNIPSVDTCNRIAQALGTDLSNLFDFPANNADAKLRPYLDEIRAMFKGRTHKQLKMAVDVVRRLFEG